MFLQQFSFVLKHKSGAQNIVADALSRRNALLVQLQTEITELECLKDLYDADSDFAKIWADCVQGKPIKDFSIRHGFLFKLNQLCIPDSSWRPQLIKEVHCGGLVAHVGRRNTYLQLQARFFWPHLHRDEHPKSWDDLLGQAEFAYNSMTNRSTGKSPFSIVYTKLPNHTVDLAVLPKCSNRSAFLKLVGREAAAFDYFVPMESGDRVVDDFVPPIVEIVHVDSGEVGNDLDNPAHFNASFSNGFVLMDKTVVPIIEVHIFV
ncbi:uncharacterized protein LOC110103126 [Dendrobium catenatum]|uniref:uncharacterized protein LOC110103126 n=1 Tax=Dendrobium catenatum TaxID=906689 RepID=UPI0009F65A57|nr:uncharacterized protein LOC110103126 [Dendrobium catenatum]